MSDLAKRQGLVRRKGSANWYYRVRIPSDLVDHFSAREKWVSLKTGDYALAVVRHSEQVATWQAAFSQVRRELASEPKSEVAASDMIKRRTASADDALRLAQAFFRQELARLEPDAETHAHYTPEQATEIEAEFDVRQADFTNPDAPDGLRSTFNVSEGLLTDAGLAADHHVMAQLRHLVGRAIVQLVAIERSRFRGDYSDRVTDSAFRGPAPRDNADPHNSPAMTLRAASARFLREVIELREPTIKTVNKHRATLDHIVGFFGAERDLKAIERSECVAFRDLIAALPPNFTKRFPGQSLKVLAAANEQGRLGLMAYDTQATYVGMMSRLFAWARDEGLVTNDLGRNLPPRARKVPREDQRDPFTIAELSAVFNAHLYRGCIDDERGYARPGPNLPRRSRFWLPLVALFTGLRAGEILQLGPDDIMHSGRGTAFILLRRGQQLKTTNARREIPIHNELIRIGFLAFVEGRRSAGEVSLFDDVPPGSDGYRSSVFSKRFGTFARGVGIKREKQDQCFHCFRHNFRDALREAGVSEEHAEALGGWSRGRKSSRSYGKGHSADALNAELQKVRYVGLDLVHLYPR